MGPSQHQRNQRAYRAAIAIVLIAALLLVMADLALRTAVAAYTAISAATLLALVLWLRMSPDMSPLQRGQSPRHSLPLEATFGLPRSVPLRALAYLSMDSGCGSVHLRLGEGY